MRGLLQTGRICTGAASALFALALLVAPAAGGTDEASGPETQLLVQFASGVSASERSELLADVDAVPSGRVDGTGTTIVTVDASEQEKILTELADSPEVAFAERDGRVKATGLYPNDTWAADAWQPTAAKFPSAWEATTGSSSVVVAVLDTGVETSHPEISVLSGYDFVNADNDADDDNGHGSASAGIIAAIGNNNTGVAGGCWQCRILPVKVLGANGIGNWSDVASGITYATDQGADVINMSLSGGYSAAVGSAVAYAIARDVIVIASAGNDDVTTMSYPGGYAGVISVAASDRNDVRYSPANGNAANWGSNWGSWVKVAAPSCSTSLWKSDANYPNGSFVYGFCGTSASAPYVAGLAGLARSLNPGLSRTEFETALYASADAVPGNYVAYGRIDAWGTLSALGAAPVAPAVARDPTITGTAAVGSQISTTVTTQFRGTEPFTLGYQWQRCNSAGTSCAPISGAVSSSYAISSADTNHRLRVVVDASNSVGTATATSSTTALVGGPPLNTTLPAISGDAVEAQSLSASSGQWSSATPLSAPSYQWRLCDSAGANCQPIPGATGATYALTTADVGARVRVAVTITNTDGQSEAVSASSAVIQYAPPTNTAAPAVSGSARVGDELAGVVGTWTSSATVTLTYQWLRCSSGGDNCAVIVGANAETYVPLAADAGMTLRLRVTASNPGGNSNATSAAMGPVGADEPPDDEAGGGDSGDGGDSSEPPDDGDGGSGDPGDGSSGGGGGGGQPPVTPPAPPSNVALPVVSGTPAAKGGLTANSGSWTGSPATYSYQWLRCNEAGADCAPVAGATEASYVATVADAGRTMRVTITASNAGGSVSATSGPSPLIPGLAPRVGSATTAHGGKTRSLTLQRPKVLAAGGVLLAQVTVRANVHISAPPGWALVSRTTSGNLTQVIYRKTIFNTSAEASHYTFRWNRSSAASGIVLVVNDARTSAPVDVHSRRAGISALATASAVRTRAANELVVVFYSTSGNATVTQSRAQGLRSLVSTGTTSPVRSVVATGTQTAAGPTGSKTARLSSRVPWVATMIVVRW